MNTGALLINTGMCMWEGGRKVNDTERNKRMEEYKTENQVPKNFSAEYLTYG
jgi:hypothetical protein